MLITLSPLDNLYKSQSSTKLPEFACIQDVKVKKHIFFGYMLDLVQAHNKTIEATRNVVLQLKTKQEHTSPEVTSTALLPEEQAWLARLAKLHRVSTPLLSSDFFQSLLSAIDIIPPSMALAQAANESAWGTSRFAVQANNLFGQWCFSKGCGLIPQQRPEGASYEVQVFETPSEAVGQYMLNLNRNQSYTKVRNIRLSYRTEQKTIPGSATVGGLEHYSARGEAYIEELRQMIRYNKLAQWDNPINNYPDISQLSTPEC